jgi:hypothetical protein
MPGPEPHQKTSECRKSDCHALVKVSPCFNYPQSRKDTGFLKRQVLFNPHSWEDEVAVEEPGLTLTHCLHQSISPEVHP